MTHQQKHILIIESDSDPSYLFTKENFEVDFKLKLDFDLNFSQILFNRLYRINYKKSPPLNLLKNQLYFFIFKNNAKEIYNKSIINDKIVNASNSLSSFYFKLAEKKGKFLLTFTKKDFEIVSQLLFSDAKIENHKNKQILKEKILGMDKWPSLNYLFKFLNKNCNWIIIRNHEFLKDNYLFKPGDDIDILCENQQFFIGMMNAKKRKGGRCSYEVNVKDQIIPLDIRYVGDKYFDSNWEKNMLKNKIYLNDMPIQSNENYFFSLLYHSKLQKFSVKEDYVSRLKFLSSELGYNFDNDFVHNNETCADILNGFLLTNNYCYTFTDDARRNELFLNLIKFKEINDSINNWRFLIKKTPRVLISKFFKKFEQFFKLLIKKNLSA